MHLFWHENWNEHMNSQEYFRFRTAHIEGGNEAEFEFQIRRREIFVGFTH